MRIVTRFLNGLLLTGLSLSLTACSNDTEDANSVNQDRIYQLHSADYDAEAQTYEWSSNFTLGGPSGTKLRLSEKAAAQVNDTDMGVIASNISGTFYFLRKQSSYSERADTFYWRDENGKEFRNSITIMRADFPTNTSESISRKSDLTITWDGEPLSAEESLKLTASQEAADGSTILVLDSTDDNKATSVTISAAKLAELIAGQAKLQLRRTNFSKDCDEATSVGGSINATYRSEEMTVTVTD